MSKIKKRVKSLETGIGMNWSDMKKIETRLNREMSEMATKLHELHLQLEGQQSQLHLAAKHIGLHKQAMGWIEKKLGLSPKVLDQSIFNDADGFWKFAATDKNGDIWLYREPPYINLDDDRWVQSNCPPLKVDGSYDTTNWQNSLIERDIAKELLEVDLSSELTGSELCKAMLARGDEWVLCLVANNPKNIDLEQEPDVVISHDENGFYIRDSYYGFAMPINHKGEPLTASEVGL